MLRKTWILAYFASAFGPLYVWIFLEARIHTGGYLGGLSALLAVPVLLAAVASFYYAWKRLGMTVNSLALARYPEGGLRNWAIGVVGFLSAWSAAFMLVVAWEVHRNPVQQTDMYRAIKVDECQFPRKCGFCGLSVSLEGAPSIRGSVCADQVRPRPVAGDALAVDGHYFSGGVYVTGIRNIGGATAPSAP